MNKSRMLLVAMHTEDVREFRAERAADMLRKRVEDLLPAYVRSTQVNDDADETRQQPASWKTRRARPLVTDGGDYEQLRRRLSRAQYCQEQMGQRSGPRCVHHTATELLNAQEAHILRLEVTEDVLRRWQLCGEMYDKYLEEDDEDLSNRE
eukprot:gene955-552_t